jgi:hypothetical protein
MTPVKQEANMYSYSDYPTSPWTEAYHAAPARQQAEDQTAPKQAFDSEAQQPTHDALSAIYNRGYSVAQQESAFLFI